jgi:NADPH2:quinone reductase
VFPHEAALSAARRIGQVVTASGKTRQREGGSTVVTSARLVEHGKPLQVEDVPLPEAGAGEVRVELRFGGVNPVDRYTAAGRTAPDGPLPRTLGAEASGYVDGKPVLVAGAGLGARRDGVWAAAAVVPETAVVPVPDGLDLDVAAVAGIAGLTAYHVVELAGVGANDRVLVLGAAGGVGLPVVSYAASIGATVWGQTGNEKKKDAITSYGAERAIVVGDAASLADAVADLRPTVVVDPLGAQFTGAAMGALQVHGRHVIFGTSAGAEGTLNIQVLYRNGISVLGYAGLQLGDDERRSGLQKTLAVLADGRMRIPIDRTVRLHDVNTAFDLLASRAVTGKIVLDLQG